MPKSCSAFNCTNRYNNKNPEITFHRFPFSKPSVLRQWLDNIGRDDFQPRKHMVICSLHFTPDSFSGLGNRKNLLWNAVPTLFAVPHQDAKQNNSRKRLKRALKSAADKCDDISPDRTPPFTEDAQTEEMLQDAQHFHDTVEVYCQTTKDLAAADHTYALLDPCTTKARLFDILDANRWLQRKLQTKRRVIKRMKLKLQDAQRELLTLHQQLSHRHTHFQRRSQLSVQCGSGSKT
ncbi:THAP domain-containing protein 3 [Rhinichthys klamathensis goyatoka]|uniref:THAP domain-containing protein 3 n=1 Tax=Rhinichthys klamathensis goyatoka TaxID=3034132 RepID=UPI0024B589CE|nr:THAP domain-containing protein 3 [Rhinichthys klamathensis goyatoka]